MYIDENYANNKRKEVLKRLQPYCTVFNVKEYDYVIDVDTHSEVLELEGTRIGCTSNSITAIMDEFIGWLFITRYCNHRSLGAYEKVTLNYLKRYWLINNNS